MSAPFNKAEYVPVIKIDPRGDRVIGDMIGWCNVFYANGRAENALPGDRTFIPMEHCLVYGAHPSGKGEVMYDVAGVRRDTTNPYLDEPIYVSRPNNTDAIPLYAAGYLIQALNTIFSRDHDLDVVDTLGPGQDDLWLWKMWVPHTPSSYHLVAISSRNMMRRLGRIMLHTIKLRDYGIAKRRKALEARFSATLDHESALPNDSATIPW